MPFDFLVMTGTHARALAFPSAHFTIGAGPECELRFPSNEVQPRHADIQVTGDRAFLTDLTGRGLSWSNGISVDKCELRPGMLVRLGQVEMMVRFQQAAEESARGENGPHVATTAHRQTPFRGPVEPNTPLLTPGQRTPPQSVALGSGSAQGLEREWLSVGSIINDRYLILSQLAAGGMGEVYKAQHVHLGKVMAIKVMRPELSQDGEFVARFKREAIATSGIGQVNIVYISDFGRTEAGRFYFVMEYLDGVTLATLVQREGAQRVDRVLAIGVQIARALAAAHSLGVVHRDLKPDNVMLLQRPSQRDLAKVVDFGVAKLPLAAGTKDRTAIGMVMGTPQYMSPEQAKAIPVDARSDIYSLGLLLYELLAGRPTFMADTPASLMAKHVAEAPPPLELGSDAPPEMLSLIDAMLAKSPDDRPQTMAEVVATLERLLGIEDCASSAAELRSVTTPATPTPPVRTPPVVPSAVSDASLGVVAEQPLAPVSVEVVEADAQPETSLKRLRLRLSVAAALVVGALTAGALWWSGSKPALQPAISAGPREAAPVKVSLPSDATSPQPRLEVLTTTPPSTKVLAREEAVGEAPVRLSRPAARSTERGRLLSDSRDRRRKISFGDDEELETSLSKERTPPPPLPHPTRDAPETMSPARGLSLDLQSPSPSPVDDAPGLPSLVENPYAQGGVPEIQTPAHSNRPDLPSLAENPYTRSIASTTRDSSRRVKPEPPVLADDPYADRKDKASLPRDRKTSPRD